MSTLVYRFGLRPPVEGEAIVRQQLRAAHEYRNDLVAIERGRRSAMRAIHETDAVAEAIAAVKASTRSTRKTALQALSKARRAAEGADIAVIDRIKDLDASIRRDARALTSCYWGTYLGIEASADQVRKSVPLYSADGITPNDPRFVRGPRWRDGLEPGDARGDWWRASGQIGVQIQGGLSTADALGGADTRVRVLMRDRTKRAAYGELWLRVGSDGRVPIWAKWPIKLHRAVPDAARWKWVRVSVRTEGIREEWSVEITVELPEELSRAHLRMMDRELDGAVAVELEWVPLDDGSMRVATWRDTRGERGTIVLPARVVQGIRKPDGIRSVRDLVLNELRPKLATLIREAKDAPPWAREAANVMHLWKSPERFRALAMRWQRERCDGARAAYEMLDAWRVKEDHLHDYESGARREALRERREIYRVLAAKWSRTYLAVILPDRDLSREARFGEDADLRFTASPQELRGALTNAFTLADAVKAPWRGKFGVVVDETDEDADAPDWLAFAIERWSSAEIGGGGARKEGKASGIESKRGGAWARRKSKRAEREIENGTARKAGGNRAE